MDFEKIISDIKELPHNLYDFAFWQDGVLQVHRFGECNYCNNSYSVAKAYTMTAIGMLWDEGKLRMSDTVASIFPEYFKTPRDPAWQMVTLEHAMTHTMGLEFDCLDIDTNNMMEFGADDFLEVLFSSELRYAPGLEHVYTDAAFYLLSRVVERVSGEKVDEFLYKRLMRPMRFREVAWSRDPLGYPIGATGLYLGAPDMIKLGLLYLQDGVYEGKRYISSKWVQRVLTREYEFHIMGDNGLIGKGGMLGQCVCFSREKGFAAAWHGCQSGENPKQLVEYLDKLA